MHRNYDEELSCPYNPAHVCLRGRIQGHLMKCRLQCDEKERSQTAVCSFNATHVVPVKEREIHELLCSDRRSADQLMCVEETFTQPTIVHSHIITLPDSEDNWDDEVTEQPVLDIIKERAKTKPVLLTSHGVPPAQRKKHRMEEKIRHRELMKGNSSSTS